MRTFISWASDVDNEDREPRRIPDSGFECPKLNRGDIVLLDLKRSRGPQYVYGVKVAYASVKIGWKAARGRNSPISDAEQSVFVEPVVFNQEQEWPPSSGRQS